nr:hypothetical protein [Lysinibacillus timonensis]
MDFSIVLMIIGILCIIASFFLKDSTKKVEKDLEELSISIYQETNSIKKRLKVVEEELLLEPHFHVKSPTTLKKQSVDKDHNTELFDLKEPNRIKNSKPVNEILVRQVIELNKQGYPNAEISRLSTLTEEQIASILANNGGNQ